MEESPPSQELVGSLHSPRHLNGQDPLQPAELSPVNHDPGRTLPSISPDRFVIDGKGGSWHQSPVLVFPSRQEKERTSSDSLPILDFDMLCATVAMQSGPVSLEIHGTAGEAGGVQRMWEGGVLDCSEDYDIALQTVCCPCVTFGRSMQRAGFGSCFGKCLQGSIYFVLVAGALGSYTLFLCSYGRLFLYLALLFVVSVAAYAGFFRIQIRRKFHIKGADTDGFISAFDDYLNHFLCGCCTLCQEARTLEMNNVQDGHWHGRGDTICVGSYSTSESNHSEPPELKQPVVITISSEACHPAADHAWSQNQNSFEPFMAHYERPT